MTFNQVAIVCAFLSMSKSGIARKMIGKMAAVRMNVTTAISFIGEV